MRLITVRHGETIRNSKHILEGHQHGRLSKLGKEQARLVAQVLKMEKLDFIYCSDLKRCKDTLNEISKYHKHIPVIFTKDLRERNVGIFQGKTRNKMENAFLKFKGGRLSFKPKHGESYLDLKKRVSVFIKYIKVNHNKDQILLVTSAGVLRVINAILTKTSLVKSFAQFKFKNTSISEYEIKNSKVTVRRFNEIKHL